MIVFIWSPGKDSLVASPPTVSHNWTLNILVWWGGVTETLVKRCLVLPLQTSSMSILRKVNEENDCTTWWEALSIPPSPLSDNH